jgi:SAM-dependent methyltransferase
MKAMQANRDFEAWQDWLRAGGVVFESSAALVAGPDHDGPLIPDRESIATFAVPGAPPVLEHRLADDVIAADHATALVARCLATQTEVAGRTALDLGCGTGVIAVLLSRLGARTVVASDVSPAALERARETARANGVAFDCRLSDMFDSFRPEERFDLVVATLPHKPTCGVSGVLPIAQDGGVDGTQLFRRLLQELPQRLAPTGSMVTFLHSLPDISLLRDMGQMGALELLAWRRRVLQPGEYGALEAEFHERARRGSSYLTPYGERHALMCGVWRLRLRRDTERYRVR